MRKAAKIIFDFLFLGQLLDLNFRRQLPGARAGPLFRAVEAHGGMPHGSLKERPLKLVVEPRIQQQFARTGLIGQLFLHMGLQDKWLRGILEIGMRDAGDFCVRMTEGKVIGQALF